MTSYQGEQPLSLHQEGIASNPRGRLSHIEIPHATSLSFLDSLGSLSSGLYRLISNPLVRGDSNISVQSDEGAHFVPYGRGHADIANQYEVDYIESITPIQSVKSKVIQNEADSSSADGSSSHLNLSEPVPDSTDVAPVDDDFSMVFYQENNPMIDIMIEECYNLLKKWNLTQYGDMLIDEMGYDDIEDWKSIKMHELIDEMQFKQRHAMQFIMKTKEYFDINQN